MALHKTNSYKNIFLLCFFCLTFFVKAQKTNIDYLDYYIEKKEFIKALNIAKKRSDLYLSRKEFEKYCEINLKKSQIYSTLNDNPKSLKALYNAISMAEKNNLKQCKTELYYTLGNKYSELQDSTKAIKYYFKAKKIGESLNDTKNLSHVYQNFFRLYSSKIPDSALYYLEKKVLIDRNNNSFSGMAINYNNYFAYYSLKNESEKGKIYLDSSIALCRKYDLKTQLVSSVSNLGYYYMVAKNDFQKAANIYVGLIKEFDGEIEKKDLNGLYLNLVYVFETLEDYKRANYYNTLYIENMSAIYNVQILEAVNDIETKYEIEKIENQYIEKQKKLEEKQSKNGKIIFIFVSLLGFSFILFYFFYQNLKLKQNNKIKELDSEIQQNIINASLDGQEIERKKIAEVLHDSISALLSSAGLHLSAFLVNSGKEIPEEIIKARTLMKEAHDKVRDLSHELIPPVLTKLGLVHAIQDLVEKNSNSLINFEFNTSISERKRYKEDFEFKIFYIIAELMNNIIKHSNGSKGIISVEEENNEILVNIKDNGKGFDLNKTQTSDGFGLTQIKARIKKLNGEFNIKSKENKGTSIFFKVKIP